MSYGYVNADVHVTGRRIVATVIDGIVFSVIGHVLGFLFGFGMGVSGLDMTHIAAGGNLLLLVIVVLYYTFMEGALGRTVGKMVTGIRVVDANTGAVPGFGKALGRTALRIIDGLGGYLLGFIVVIVDDRRRRVGDMVAATQVIRG